MHARNVIGCKLLYTIDFLLLVNIQFVLYLLNDTGHLLRSVTYGVTLAAH